MIKQFIINLLPQPFLNRYRSYRYRTQRHNIILEWESKGKPLPVPHVVKQVEIEKIQRAGNYEVLVETGTFLGDMVEAERQNFKKIYSIELSQKLFVDAKKRFRKYPHIELLQGDSGKVLPQIVQKLAQPALFWLDGHYSGGITALGEKECPIYEELDAILDCKYQHGILIDDAGDFTGQNDYPTIEAVKQYLSRKTKLYNFFVDNNIIYILPEGIKQRRPESKQAV